MAAADLHTLDDPVPPLGLRPRYALLFIDPRTPDVQPQLVRRDLEAIFGLDWSPSGNQLLLEQEYGPVLPGQASIVLSRYKPTEDHLDVWLQDQADLTGPRWWPQRSHVIYNATPRSLQARPVSIELRLHDVATGNVQRLATAEGCDLLQPTWAPDGQQLLAREVCRNLNDRRVDRLVVVSPEQPLDRIEACDGQSLDHPDWGPNDQVVAMTIEYGSNHLVICNLSGVLERSELK